MDCIKLSFFSPSREQDCSGSQLFMWLRVSTYLVPSSILFWGRGKYRSGQSSKIPKAYLIWRKMVSKRNEEIFFGRKERNYFFHVRYFNSKYLKICSTRVLIYLLQVQASFACRTFSVANNWLFTVSGNYFFLVIIGRQYCYWMVEVGWVNQIGLTFSGYPNSKISSSPNK